MGVKLLCFCCCLCCCFCSLALFGQDRTIMCVDSISSSVIDKFQVEITNQIRPTQFSAKKGIVRLSSILGDTLILLVSSKNHENKTLIILPNHLEITVKLQHKTVQLDEVKVQNASVHSTSEVGKLSLSKKDIEKLPTLLGESDPIRVMQLLPGIQSSGDGNGIFVRGGGIDQNLVQLDGMPIYNISHLFGFFSVFNSGAIQKMEMEFLYVVEE